MSRFTFSEATATSRPATKARLRSDQDFAVDVSVRLAPSGPSNADVLRSLDGPAAPWTPEVKLGFYNPIAGAPARAVETGTSVAVGTPASAAATSPTDPLYPSQWHLGLLGGIEKVWADYTGEGVHVGVYDSGIQYDHPDLNGNYDAALELTIDGVTYDGDYRPLSGAHGTAVAGIIAAERNGVGTVGVAYDASLTGVNIFDPFSGGGLDSGIYVNGQNLDLFFRAIAESARFDVVNHSWGGAPLYVPENGREEGTFASRLHNAITFAAETGRGGLGTVQVKAAGNDGLDVEGEGSQTDRHFIIVGAYREVDGSASYYSNRGGGLLISAPSSDYSIIGGTGVVTTDLVGRDGYNLAADPGGVHDYTDSFGGTSAAAPVVSGVVSLMLDANADLGWRDVREILASSATTPVPFETGQTFVDYFGPVILNEGRFAFNGDTNWNGGGKHFSPDYGYGAVNAFNAVRMAEVWNLFGEAKTSANEVAYSTPVYDIDLKVPSPRRDIWTEENYQSDFDGKPVSFTFEVGGDVRIEHLDFVMTYDFGYKPSEAFPIREQGNLDGWKIRLTSPDGTQVFVDTGVYLERSTSFEGTEQTWTFGFAGFIGEGSAGTWTVEVEDPFARDLGFVRTVQANFYGSEISSDDVFHFTDEFFAMAAVAGEDGRTTLTDSDGGIDWIDAAAITDAVSLSLRAGAVTMFGDKEAFTITAGSLIENAVTGDGDDRLSGNRSDNALHGMRGGDTLRGFGGNDMLEGGVGDDLLRGGSGHDVFLFDNRANAGRDRIGHLLADDVVVTTVALDDADGDGRISLGRGGVLDLGQGGAVTIAGEEGAAPRRLEFDGVFNEDGVQYFMYSTVGSNTDLANAGALLDLPG